MSTSIDVVICTRQRPRALERCVESLALQTRRPDRILVIDGGGSTPIGTDQPAGNVEVVSSDPGLTRQRNLGLTLGDGDLVAFLDDDTELEPGYLDVVDDWFDQHQQCVGVGGNIVNDPVRHLPSRLFRRLFALADADGRLRRSGEANYLRHPIAPTRVDVLSGSNMVFRRSAIEGLRFDEEFAGYGYMEDVDFCLQASPRGELWTVPDAKLTHNQTGLAQTPRQDFVEQALVNGTLVYVKHRARFELQSLAFARRVLGRCCAYLALGLWRRSLEPIHGMARGFKGIRRALSNPNA